MEKRSGKFGRPRLPSMNDAVAEIQGRRRTGGGTCETCKNGLVYYMYDPASETYVEMGLFTSSHPHRKRGAPVACDCDLAYEKGYLATNQSKGKRPWRLERVTDIEDDFGFRRCTQPEAYDAVTAEKTRILNKMREEGKLSPM